MQLASAQRQCSGTDQSVIVGRALNLESLVCEVARWKLVAHQPIPVDLDARGGLAGTLHVAAASESRLGHSCSDMCRTGCAVAVQRSRCTPRTRSITILPVSMPRRCRWNSLEQHVCKRRRSFTSCSVEWERTCTVWIFTSSCAAAETARGRRMARFTQCGLLAPSALA